MSTSTKTFRTALRKSAPQQIATFYIGDILIGIDIMAIQEINRHVQTTPVPHAPPYVRGVLNLRGEVVTVMDPRIILELDPIEITRDSRTIIIRHAQEYMGLLIDRVGEVMNIDPASIQPAPANFEGVAGRFFEGVIRTEEDLLVILDIDEILGNVTHKSPST